MKNNIKTHIKHIYKNNNNTNKTINNKPKNWGDNKHKNIQSKTTNKQKQAQTNKQ